MKSSLSSDGCCSLDPQHLSSAGNDLLCRSAIVTARSWRSEPMPRGVAGIFCRQRWFTRYARSECRLCVSF